MYKFKIIKNKKGEFRAQFSFRTEPIFWTENYTKRAAAKNAIDKLIKNVATAQIEEVDESVKTTTKKASTPVKK
jgi:uncharacterized protein YegP (UPF0339 family)